MLDEHELRDALRFLVNRIHTELEAKRWPHSASLIRLDEGDIQYRHHVDLRIKALDEHPATALAGFVAPPEWMAVGLVTGGWAYPAASGGAERVRMHLIHLVSRSNVEVSAVRRSGESLVLLEERAEGLVADALRRVLELPTAPPDVDPNELLVVWWLDAIVKAGKRGKRASKLDWAHVVGLQPASFCGPDDFSWERLRRRLAAEGDSRAAWMDAGMFARWMISAYPPLGDLLARAKRRVSRSAARELEATLAERGLHPGTVLTTTPASG